METRDKLLELLDLTLGALNCQNLLTQEEPSPERTISIREEGRKVQKGKKEIIELFESLEPIQQNTPSEEEIEEVQTQIENCIQPHAITFNRGVIATENAMDVIKDFMATLSAQPSKQEPISEEEIMEVEYHPHTEPSFMYDSLLPCPFCGGEAELLFIGNSHTKSRKAEIKCKKCFARIVNAALRHGSEWIAKHSIDDWNKRQAITNLLSGER